MRLSFCECTICFEVCKVFHNSWVALTEAQLYVSGIPLYFELKTNILGFVLQSFTESPPPSPLQI